MTHDDLRKRAVKWLTNSKRCSVVLSEMVSGTSEVPDAVGWKAWSSYLVECKVSRSDFKANGDKPVMRTGRGVGQYRFILCPKDLIQPDEVTDDWGLLWCSDSGNFRLMKEAARREACRDDEITMLVSALRRVKTREFLVLVAESTETSDADATS